LSKARTDLADLRQRVKLEVKTAYLDMQHARESAEAGEGNVALAERALAIAKNRHKSGLSTYLEVTDANVGLSRAKLSHLAAMRRHMNAVAELLCAAGIEEDLLEEEPR
jgi:outer membrane protein TolC